MLKAQPSLKKIVAKLEAHYGTPAPPTITDPLHLVLLENVAYLVDDKRREAALAALRDQVGLEPPAILAASTEQLAKIVKTGAVFSEIWARKLKEIALIVLNDFEGDLHAATKLPLAKAIGAFKKFPSIGVPGAERILLFVRAYPILALESNGLRVLLRLGFGQESKNYSKSYASVRDALADQVGEDCEFLIRAHQLLRQHGKTLCKTSRPACPTCPLRRNCRYAVMSQ